MDAGIVYRYRFYIQYRFYIIYKSFNQLYCTSLKVNKKKKREKEEKKKRRRNKRQESHVCFKMELTIWKGFVSDKLNTTVKTYESNYRYSLWKRKATTSQCLLEIFCFLTL